MEEEGVSRLLSSRHLRSTYHRSTQRSQHCLIWFISPKTTETDRRTTTLGAILAAPHLVKYPTSSILSRLTASQKDANNQQYGQRRRGAPSLEVRYLLYHSQIGCFTIQIIQTHTRHHHHHRGSNIYTILSWTGPRCRVPRTPPRRPRPATSTTTLPKLSIRPKFVPTRCPTS